MNVRILTFESFLLEQGAPEGTMDRRLGIQDRNMKALGLNPSSTSDIKKYRESVYGKDLTGHEAAMIMQIATALIPVAGPFISAGIGFGEAVSYWDEGKKEEAALTAILSMFPLLLEIPGVKTTLKGLAGMAKRDIEGLIYKVFNKNAKDLTFEEYKILKAITDNRVVIEKQIAKNAPIVKSITPELKQLKPDFIKNFSEDTYNWYFKSLMTGKIPKEEFMRIIKGGISLEIPQLVKLGIKFTGGEIKAIEEMTSQIIADGLKPGKIYGGNVFFRTRSGLKPLKIQTLSYRQAKKLFKIKRNTWGYATHKGQIYIIPDNLKFAKFMNPGHTVGPKEIRELITHEIAHVKDPAIIRSSKLCDIYEPGGKLSKNYTAHQFEVQANLAAGLDSMGFTFEKFKKIMPKEQLEKYLDSMLDWARSGFSDAKFSKINQWKGTPFYNVEKRIALEGMFGRSAGDQILDLIRANDTKQLRKFVSRLSQEAMRLKKLL